MLNRLLFSRIEAWIVVLLALLAILGAIAFGALVLAGTQRPPRFGALAQGAKAVASIPFTVEKLLEADKQLQAITADRFIGQPSGWTVDPAFAGKIGGYLLLSRFDGIEKRHVVELVSLRDMATVHAWKPDAEALLADVARTSQLAQYDLWFNETWRAIHPFLMETGDLIIKDHQSPLFRIDACSGHVWTQDRMMFHHSTNSDGEGGFWIPSLYEPQTVEGTTEETYEDGIAHVSAEGEVLWKRSMLQVFLDHGLEHRLFPPSQMNQDPTHMNDIEPVLADGPYWKKGDLFISFRRLSMVILYRPSTDQIVWMKDGPWMAQHDVDIVDSTRIAVFDNAAYDRGRGGYVRDYTRIAVYDFATDTVSYPYAAAMEKAETKTLYEGLSDLMPGGLAMVEEENAGRILIVGQNGEIAASYLNMGDGGLTYRLGWSRYIDQATGDAVAAKLAATSCPAGG